VSQTLRLLHPDNSANVSITPIKITLIQSQVNFSARVKSFHRVVQFNVRSPFVHTYKLGTTRAYKLWSLAPHKTLMYIMCFLDK